MDNKTTRPAEIALSLHGRVYSITNLDWDINGEDLLREFEGLMIAAGFSPSILNDENGEWHYAEKDSEWSIPPKNDSDVDVVCTSTGLPTISKDF